MTAQHHEEPTSFAFDAESNAAIDRIVARYPAGKQASAVIPLLYIVQKQMKRETDSAWVPHSAEKKARSAGSPEEPAPAAAEAAPGIPGRPFP